MKKRTKSFVAFSLSCTLAYPNVMVITNAQSANSVKASEKTSLVTGSFTNGDSSSQIDPKENSKYNMGLSNTSTFSIASRALPNLEVTPVTDPNIIGLGVCTANTLNVRSGPSTSYDVLGTISNNTNIEILEKNGNWYKISFNNNYGYVSATYISLNPIQKGIDVSKWNGTVDWNKVKASGIDYVIIRAGFGSSTVDPYFHSHIQGAINAGLEVGVYWFSYATSAAKAKIEAQKCIETISPYKDKISYPVFFDFEYDSVDYAVKQGVAITKDLATNMANTFLDYVESKGYVSGLYTNNDFGSRYFSKDLLSSSYLWIAQYSSVCTYPTPYMMWQYTDKGTIDGIGTSSNPKYFDMNYTFLKPSKTSTNTTKIDLSKGSVDEIDSQVYTGEEIKPSVKVSYEGKELVLGKDYEVKYSNNISIGTAKVTITGIGDYKGSIETTFEITRYVPNKVTNVSLTKKTYDSLSFSWSQLNDVTGYEIYKYDSNTKTYKLLKNINNASTTTYKDNNLSPLTSYRYKIRGYKVINGEYFYGDFSDVFKETTSELSVIETGVTKSGVNVRKGPSTSYDKIGYLTSGTKVEIVGTDSETGWYQIKYNDGYAYVSNLYVTLQSSSTPSTSTTKTGVTTTGLNVRKGPSTSYDKVGYLASGTKVEIVDTDSKTGWYKIKYNGGYAYVSNLYVTLQNSSTSTTKTGVTTSGVNVRKGPSTSYDKVGYLASGTKVEIVDTDSKTGWYKIKYNNSYAYVSNKYVSIENSSTSTTKTGVTTTGLNVRKGPSTSYDKVGYLASGTKVTIVDTDSKTGWYKIKYNNSYAYVSNKYVTINK